MPKDEPTSRNANRTSVATELVHGACAPAEYHGFVNPPVVHASTVLFPDVDTYDRRAQKYTYGMYTPTHEALAQLVSKLEGAQGTVIVPSGLIACTMAIAAVVKAGDRLLMVDNVYHPTRHFCDGFLARMGVETIYFDPLDDAALARELEDGAAAVFLEAPGSLTFEMPDVVAQIALAKRHGAISIMDNTWATPLYFQPLAHGCDLSVQAATKYMSGGSDLLLGTIAGNGEPLAAVKRCVREVGSHTAPDDVYLTLRGMRSLAVRMAHHQRSARRVAEWLSAHPMVARVLYPALPDAQGHAVWKSQFSGASGLFGVTFRAPRELTATFVNALELFGIGSSWGGFESLATVPDVNLYRSATRWPRDETVVRLSIGLEDPDDLIADLAQALHVMARASGGASERAAPLAKDQPEVSAVD